MKKITGVLLLVLLNANLCPVVMALTQQIVCNGKRVLGRVEKITLLEKNFSLDAKLDTGADMASLSASDIKIFKRDNKTWVGFTVSENKKQTKIIFVKPLIRYVHILKRKEEGNQHIKVDSKQFGTRPVVPILVCIGNQKKTILVNLIDRSQFNYPMLIGSSTLKELHVLVDVSQKHLTEPSCS